MCKEAPDGGTPYPDPPPDPHEKRRRRDVKRIWDAHVREMSQRQRFGKVKEIVDTNIAESKKKLS